MIWVNLPVVTLKQGLIAADGAAYQAGTVLLVSRVFRVNENDGTGGQTRLCLVDGDHRVVLTHVDPLDVHFGAPRLGDN